MEIRRRHRTDIHGRNYLMSEKQLRVDISRQFVPKRTVRGLDVFNDTGMNYVDVYFPDGSQKVMGYISRGRTDVPFSPCHKTSQEVYDAIQGEINRMNGYVDGTGPEAPFSLAEEEPEEDYDE